MRLTGAPPLCQQAVLRLHQCGKDGKADRLLSLMQQLPGYAQALCQHMDIAQLLNLNSGRA